MIESMDHFWQNWSKTHAYVAERMFFPASVAEIAEAIRTAEADKRPLRAVGGGWSFSDASLPGNVTTNRPKAHGVAAIAKLLPAAQKFPTNRVLPFAANVTPSPVTDAPGVMAMVDMGLKPPAIDTRWSYVGGDLWMDAQGSLQGPLITPNFIDALTRSKLRPVRAPSTFARAPGAAPPCLQDCDAAGTLVMFDLNENTTIPSRDWFYNGGGVWMVGVSVDSAPRKPDEGSLVDLLHAGRLTRPGGMNLTPRAADPAESLSVLLSKAPYTPTSPEPVYLINTRSLVSSLQQSLPNILTASALDETSRTPATGKRRYFFHVEAGITINELGNLLAHQSPRLSLQSVSGSPGATLAGALATATHGAEFTTPLLIDTVKAVHLVGPGGIQWWIEGDEAIADPQKLRQVYPGIAPERIVRGGSPIGGVVPHDWLGAAVVNLGCLGVIYSVVLEVVPLFGVREVVVQKTWRELQLGTRFAGQDIQALLRDPATAKTVSSRITKLMQAGNLNGTDIPQVDPSTGQLVNFYADLAINPVPRGDGDFDCWIANRETTRQLPVDSQPASDMFSGIAKAFEPENPKKSLGKAFWLPDVVGPTLNTAIFGATQNWGKYESMLKRIARAADLYDVAFDTFLTPISDAPDPDRGDAAQALLTGLLSGLLGTANCDKRSDLTGLSVGNLGFPASGIMGAALEIALSPADAFGLVQSEILDKLDRRNPFFGYISVRLCKKTETLMGMQQYVDPDNPCSVMVEVVAFGNDDARRFIAKLQKRCAKLIKGGLDAMLHWGLENEEIEGAHLLATKALAQQSRSGMSKLSTFKAVRALLHQAGQPSFRVFDSAFTDRLGLSSGSAGLAFADENGSVISTWTPEAYNSPPGSPLVENQPIYLKDLCLINQSDRWIKVDDVRIVSSADKPGAPVFTAVAPQTPFNVPISRFFPVFPLTFEYRGTSAGSLTGTVLVEFDRPVGGTTVIDFSASVVANRHAELQVTPASLDFGTAQVGTEAGLSVKLINAGVYPALIDSITVTEAVPALPRVARRGRPPIDVLPDNNVGTTLSLEVEGRRPSRSFSIPPTTMASIPAGATAILSVSFAPKERGSAEARVSIDAHSRTDIANVEHRIRRDVLLTGMARAPEFLIAASRNGSRVTVLDFGAPDQGQTASASFFVRNIGDIALSVENVQIHDQTRFAIPDLSIFPASLDPGEALEVPCSFTPLSARDDATSAIIVLTNDPRQAADPGIGALIVKGRAGGARLSGPEVFALGTQPPLATQSQLVLRSIGTTPVTVRSLKLLNTDGFAISNFTVPQTIQPGNDLSITVALTATQPGSYLNRLFVEHNGVRGEGSDILLTGLVS